jgi:poly(3-hydroxybutyrate) depolymerase
MLDAILQDLHTRLGVEPTRTCLWGFSAGAHFGHALALDNPDIFAAYAVSAGALGQYACSVPPQLFNPPCATYLPAVTRKVPVEIWARSGPDCASTPSFRSPG